MFVCVCACVCLLCRFLFAQSTWSNDPNCKNWPPSISKTRKHMPTHSPPPPTPTIVRARGHVQSSTQKHTRRSRNQYQYRNKSQQQTYCYCNCIWFVYEKTDWVVHGQPGEYFTIGHGCGRDDRQQWYAAGRVYHTRPQHEPNVHHSARHERKHSITHFQFEITCQLD